MSFDENSIRSYIYSDYSVDDKWQGYISRGPVNAHANWGRATSALDITSQVGKAFFGTIGSVAYAGVDLIVGGVSLVILIPTAIVWKVLDCTGNDYGLGEKVGILLHNGVHRPLRAIFTIVIGIPLSLIWRVCMIVADVLGMLLPEIGRKARILDKIGTLVLKEFLDKNNITHIEKKEGARSYQRGWSSDGDLQALRVYREAPQYSHDATTLRAHQIAQSLVGAIECIKEIGKLQMGVLSDDAIKIERMTFKNDFLPIARTLYARHDDVEWPDVFDAEDFFYNELYCASRGPHLDASE